MQPTTKVSSTHSPVNSTHEQPEVGLMSLSPGLFHHYLTFWSRKVLTLSQASEGFCYNLLPGYLLCLGTKKRDTPPKLSTKGRAMPALELSLSCPCTAQINVTPIPTQMTSCWTKFSQLLYPKKSMSEARS